ncbi:hypothetical protein CLOLEP_00030 [[Clostridium] leptum DSM 753]|uniref:Uncharacterized protein n=1 Tax=[Clostridium] leptum DSM 753 TaxID=428125 RepID=A7VNA6_9FIRM|nr:hypothetical protein CLOLEP_00030 [[Clostridium] leptum DSM 753]
MKISKEQGSRSTRIKRKPAAPVYSVGFPPGSPFFLSSLIL